MGKNLTEGECNAIIQAIEDEYVLVGRPIQDPHHHRRLYIVRHVRGGYIMRNADRTDRIALLMRSRSALELVLQTFLSGLVLYQPFDWYQNV